VGIDYDPRVRALIYVDSVYRQVDGSIYGELSITTFLAALAPHMEVTIIGRLDPNDGPARYRIPPEVRFVALPHYRSLTRPSGALSALSGSTRRFWRALEDADVVWLFGPFLFAQVFAMLALLRRRRVVLGVRQDLPTYVRQRHPSLRWIHVAGDGLEWTWRAMARVLPTITVGQELAANYRPGAPLLPIAVSLVTQDDVRQAEAAPERDYDGDLQLLSVGRLEEEKNPLLLADVLALLRRRDPRWRLVICGDGPMRDQLTDRFTELGMADHVALRGHVPLREGLLELYRQSHVFLHVSWTEGFPMVLIEAFASGVPAVATAVGGVPHEVGDAAILIEPGDPVAAADAVSRVVADPELRAALVSEGFRKAQEHTMEYEVTRVAAFLRDGTAPAPAPAAGANAAPVAPPSSPRS
jgi:glycosyltransferase involved in cell wall biosynthesis